MKSSYIAQIDSSDAEEMTAEERPAEGNFILLRLQRGMTNSDKDCESNNASRSQQAEKRSEMRNAGAQHAFEDQNRGQKIQTTEKMPGKCERPP